jgi:hypothetical protein
MDILTFIFIFGILVGSICLGILIGFLIMICIKKLKKFTLIVFSTIIGIIAGGAIVNFMQNRPLVLGLYLIGLLIGFLLYQAAHWNKYKEALIAVLEPNIVLIELLIFILTSILLVCNVIRLQVL